MRSELMEADMQIKCSCCEQHDSIAVITWHRAYRRWHDHRDAGREVRAATWGWIADRICAMNNRLGLWGV